MSARLDHLDGGGLLQLPDERLRQFALVFIDDPDPHGRLLPHPLISDPKKTAIMRKDNHPEHAKFVALQAEGPSWRS
jgi:hypothetical protein